MHQKQLRSLTSDELGPYTSSALLTVGALPDLKYFLPRIFELAVLEPHVYPDLEIRLSKLAYGNWLEWPATEQKAVEHFLTEWIKGLVAQSPPDGNVIDAVVCGMARAGCNIGRALATVSQSLDAFVAVYDVNEGFLLKKGRPSNGFWQDVDPRTVAQYKDWLEDF